jgi:hypothetical protein
VGRTTAYKELDEIAAVDRRMVVMLLERPRSAPMVEEYADREGQTKVLVVYASDLGQIFEVLPEPV